MTTDEQSGHSDQRLIYAYSVKLADHSTNSPYNPVLSDGLDSFRQR